MYYTIWSYSGCWTELAGATDRVNANCHTDQSESG